MSLIKVRVALENALNAMVGIIPTSTIDVSLTSGLVRTTTPHGLVDGVSVSIYSHAGSTPNLNGRYYVTVIDQYNVTLQDSINSAPISISIGGSGGIISANLTAWDNVSFQPVSGVPYQSVSLMPAKPENPTFGSPFHRERGILQVTLFYPIQLGTKDITTRAELIRSVFFRNSTFTKDDINVIIDRTPEIVPPSVDIDGDRYMMPVKIQYHADIFS